MNLNEILNSLTDGDVTVEKAKELLSLHAIEKIENVAQIDLGRKIRKGIPEVIFAESKQVSDIQKIISKVMKKTDSMVISRINRKNYRKIIDFSKKQNLKVKTGKNTTTILISKKNIKMNSGVIGIITAGTSDIGVGEEARLISEAMNCKCICSYDVGIAGLHRTFPVLKEFTKSGVDSVIVVAGMEGALASVVSSLIDVPVIGVPTSVGYGYGEKGIAALASMLQSCSLGLAVVNIDNGIGAGAIAANIANKIHFKKNNS